MKTNSRKQEKRQIKVCAKWQGEKRVPSINLQGVYLRDFGFMPGERVKVELSHNRITIKKLSAGDILEVMNKQNPSLERLIKEFGLVIAD